jgi:hypothetical protein
VRQRDVAIDVQKVAMLHASAPGEAADFELPAARLDLSFEASGTPLCCVEVQIEAGERQFTRRTDELGRIGFMIQPELVYQLTAGRNGFTTKRTQLRGLTDGEHRPEKIALEPQIERATLIIDDGGTAGAERATFELRPRFLSGQKHPEVERTVERDPRTRKFSLANVPTGSWRVTMRSGSPLTSNDSVTSNCDQDVVVDVPESGSIEAAVTIVRRGGLRVAARMQNGTRVTPSSVQLLDPDGDAIDGVSVLGNPISSRDVTVFESRSKVVVAVNDTEGNVLDRVYGGAPLFVYSSWCAGSADLVVAADGALPSTVRVSIVAGQVTPVDVVLRPK